MATIIIIETLDKNGKVHERHLVNKLPFKLGRGYQSDLIMDDDFVSPLHAQIESDAKGDLVIVDQQSKNGVFYFKNSQRIDVAAVQSGTEIRLGHTRVRFRMPDFEVANALRDVLHDHVISRVLNNYGLLWIIWALIFTIVGLDKSMGNYNDDSLLQMLDDVIPDFLRLMVWVGLWVIINRSTTHATNIGAHLLVAFSGYAGLIMIDGLNNYVSFIFSLGDEIYILEYLSTIIIIMAVFYGHLRFCSLATPKRVLSIASTIAVSIVGLIWFSEAVDESFSYNVDFSVQLKPPAFNFVVNDDLNDFFASSTSLKAAVDEEVALSLQKAAKMLPN